MLKPTYHRTMLVSALQYLLAMPIAVRAASSGASSGLATSYFIDTITGYNDLSTCAEQVVSTIVRAQSSGCGDGGALTSYTCFCTDSSSLMSYEITSAISLSCSSSIWSAQASRAISVFDAYCALGGQADTARITAASTAASTSTGSPSPAATAGTTATLSTSTPVTATSAALTTGSASSSSRTVAIAAGVAVPCSVVGLALIGFLFWRRRRTHSEARSEKQQRLESALEGTGSSGAKRRFPWSSGMAGARELPTQLHYAQEMPLGKDFSSPSTSSSSQISPEQACTPAFYQVHEAEQYQRRVAAPQGQEPQELPASN